MNGSPDCNVVSLHRHAEHMMQVILSGVTVRGEDGKDGVASDGSLAIPKDKNLRNPMK